MSNLLSQDLTIYFLNVGNGDCTIIKMPDQTYTVVDIMNGRVDNSHRPDFVNPIHFLKDLTPPETMIHRYIQTHPDMDHMDGFYDLQQCYQIINFWDTANTRASPEEYQFNFRKQDWDGYQRIRQTSSVRYYTRNLNKIRHTTGEYIYDLYSINPTEELVKIGNKDENWNLMSHIVLLKYNNFKLLLSGDADDASWQNLYEWISLDKEARQLLENVTILKAAHHGRKSSYCGSNLLNIINPQEIIISRDYVPSDESAKLNYKYFLENKGSGRLIETDKGTCIATYNGASNRYGIQQDSLVNTYPSY